MAGLQSFAIMFILCLTILRSLAVAQAEVDYEASAPDGFDTVNQEEGDYEASAPDGFDIVSVESLNDPPLPPTELNVNSGPETYLESCAEKLSNTLCGEQIVYDAVSDEEMSTVSAECCVQLLNMGYDCHSALIVALLGLPEYQPLAAKILAKREVTWIRCNQDVAAAAGPAVEPLPSDVIDMTF